MIDSKAIVDVNAEIAEDVTIGPFSVIGPEVQIDSGTVIGPHVVIKGPTQIGVENQIFQFASIGDDPQDKKYNGETTRLEIGSRNVIREFCSINRGTVQDAQVTRIGDDNCPPPSSNRCCGRKACLVRYGLFCADWHWIHDD